VKIGILPGFGGTQRLPRLIGVSKALDVILKARMLPAPQAQRTGMLDRVIDLPGSNATPEALYAAMLQEARDVASGIKKISRQSLSLMDRIMTHTAPGRAIVRSKVRASIMKETRGHYPAPLKALESVVYGLAHGLEAGTHEERKLVTELVISPECKSLV